ncbi:TPA: immunity protein Tsi6 family protein [Enterobacter ludwigii]
MNEITALDYVEKTLSLSQKRYAEVRKSNPQSPLLQMYDSTVQQLLFLRDLIEGKEKDKAKLWKMTFGMYAAKEFDNSDELFFERLSDAWFIVDQIRRGLKVRLPHEVDANYRIKQQNLKMKYPDEFWG